ncbi:hypothetical protein DPX16_1852 [Anabarilius grahami]|uniref:Uncharacterized protein n=1 Tax=Anabarilius grahami TaxID=495550 RepID=A0A3N0Z954_ANAGA|nr:hypothetical protein DPX16_1852 [Anabarilius grahami]
MAFPAMLPGLDWLRAVGWSSNIDTSKLFVCSNSSRELREQEKDGLRPYSSSDRRLKQSTDKKRRNSATKKKEIAADMEASASSASACLNS